MNFVYSALSRWYNCKNCLKCVTLCSSWVMLELANPWCGSPCSRPTRTIRRNPLLRISTPRLWQMMSCLESSTRQLESGRMVGGLILYLSLHPSQDWFHQLPPHRPPNLPVTHCVFVVSSLQVSSLPSCETWPTWVETAPSGLYLMATLTLCGSSLSTLSWMTTRYNWQFSAECPTDWGFISTLLIYGNCMKSWPQGDVVVKMLSLNICYCWVRK